MALTNPSFETGSLSGWTVLPMGSNPLASVSVVAESGYSDSGTYACKMSSSSGLSEAIVVNDYEFFPAPGSTVSISARARSTKDKKGNVFASIGLLITYKDGTTSRVVSAEKATNELRDGFTTLSYASSFADNVASVRMFVRGRVEGSDRHVYFDTCTIGGSEITGDAVELRFPANGATYNVGDVVPFRVSVQQGVSIASLNYEVTNTATAVTTTIAGSGTEFKADYSTLPEASYSVVAKATLSNGPVLTTKTHNFAVGPAAALPTREFKASNSYTYLILQNFQNLAANMPPTAIVTGAELEVTYRLKFLIRSIDKDISEPSAARYEAAFTMVPSLVINAQALRSDGTALEAVGTASTINKQLQLSDFSVIEDGVSEGKRWTVLQNAPETVTIGAEGSVFGLQQIQAGAFLDYSLGLKAYPLLGTKPEWAGSGDACIRVLLDKVRLKVYFDAGSVEYYFVNPDDSDDYIKGTLAAVYVDGGDLRNGDGSGIMQLLPELEPEGTIPAGWDIHSALPPTDRNKIGVVATAMKYNGLPSYAKLDEQRSRSLFITANFYGDPALSSIYGVNGAGRAFAYNGDYFYKITTHPDELQDSPRHVAYHHGHLALGYNSGRVDLSVVGDPWNFSGADGASSWAIGDEVTGLLPLPGTMLGIYGKKSITGLSGTTVDNFATQTISPKLGAVEYTVTDMGFPVHANAYGIYTLAQTADYGDYLGVPLSQQVSPWLRPRLIRNSTSAKEVVVAWPVRSKNQYRLAFSDGYVLTMTMNNGNQGAPTFSKQKYTTGAAAQSARSAGAQAGYLG